MIGSTFTSFAPNSSSTASARRGNHSIAVVIPVYNHGSHVRTVIEKSLLLGFPVIVVDDGSTDDTFSILQSMPAITLLRHDTNRGKGQALLTGMSAASQIADYVLTLDADGQHDPADAQSLVAALGNADARPIVVGRRENMLRDSSIPWTSRFGRSFSNFWVRASGGPKLSDTQSGFRLYPIPETLRLKTPSKRFQFEVDVLVRAHWKGIPIIEAPITVDYRPAGQRISHFRPVVDFFRNSLVFTSLITMRLLFPKFIRRRFW
jgi:glycosyltransferase involved in cell wall biosynthesis